jgi:hypothetical protein
MIGLLNQSCVIQAKGTQVSTTTGGIQPTWVDRSPRVRCTIQANTARETNLARRETGEATFDGFFEAVDGRFPRVYDRITDILPPITTTSGYTLEAIGQPIDDGGYGRYVRVELRQVEGGPVG